MSSMNLLIFISLTLIVTSIGYLEGVKPLDLVPKVSDSGLKVELIFEAEVNLQHGDMNLSPVSSMTFLGTNDILLLDKNYGAVHRIVNGIVKEPVLDVNVANKRERGMLGIDSTTYTTSNITKDETIKYVFLYYTESKYDGNDLCPTAGYCKPGNDPLGNRLYRYEIKDNKLVNPKLLLDLPGLPGPAHNGGVVEIGPDNNVYVTVGDLLGNINESSKTKAQNFRNGTDPDGRAGILRITQDGQPVGNGILGQDKPLNWYYAYGIRNSFGIDFDPRTGNLWDTENGPDYGDEINLVRPGFNSGWIVVQGIWRPGYDRERGPGADLLAGAELLNPDKNDLENFDGKGEYSAPEFIWNQTVGPTAIKFLHSDKYGMAYKDDLFVGDVSLGYIYHFDLNKDRNALLLNGTLEDKVANTFDELKQIIFAKGFYHIVDIEVGPDGYLYILSHGNGKARIFKIVPTNSE
jgi:glucose/arabinose dehydrogenase